MSHRKAQVRGDTAEAVFRVGGSEVLELELELVVGGVKSHRITIYGVNDKSKTWQLQRMRVRGTLHHGARAKVVSKNF